MQGGLWFQFKRFAISHSLCSCLNWWRHLLRIQHLSRVSGVCALFVHLKHPDKVILLWVFEGEAEVVDLLLGTHEVLHVWISSRSEVSCVWVVALTWPIRISIYNLLLMPKSLELALCLFSLVIDVLLDVRRLHCERVYIMVLLADRFKLCRLLRHCIYGVLLRVAEQITDKISLSICLWLSLYFHFEFQLHLLCNLRNKLRMLEKSQRNSA